MNPFEMENIFDSFEGAWRSQERPSIEEFLTNIGEADQESVFKELFAIELVRRMELGEIPKLQEYEQRFTKFSAVLHDVFRDTMSKVDGDRRGKGNLISENSRLRPERERLLKLYQGAILGYLGVYLANEDAVTDVWGEFIDSWLDGKLPSYEATRLFPTQLKEILKTEAACYRSKQGRKIEGSGVQRDSENRIESQVEREASAVFDRNLGEQMLLQALEAMGPGSNGHQVLTYLREAAYAGDTKLNNDALEAVLGKTAEDTERIVYLAKKEYSRRIIEQVSELIQSRNVNFVREMLSDLKLLPYCQKALAEWSES